MRSMLLACAAVLLFGGSSASAAYNFRTGECNNCQPYHQGHGAHVLRRPVLHPAPNAYRHAGYGFDEDYCVDGHGRRIRCSHIRGGLHGMGGGAGAHPWQDGPPSGPPTAHVGYPYYTLRGPRDFLLNNPPSIGP